jgi:small subunit ribosomal protein S5
MTFVIDRHAIYRSRSFSWHSPSHSQTSLRVSRPMLQPTLFRLTARTTTRRTAHLTQQSAFSAQKYRSYASSSVPPAESSSSPSEPEVILPVAKTEGQVNLDDYYFFNPHPNLLTHDPILDSHESTTYEPTKKNPHGGKVTVRNETSVFKAAKQAEAAESGERDSEAKEASTDDEGYSVLNHLQLSRAEMANLHYYPLFTRRITQQTGKGKIHRQYSLVVVGNGNGLVGYGEGKDEELPRATDKAYAEAIRNMDYVERFENRTVWTETHTKLGATRIIVRPRPLGFGLRCNPNIHQILKAAGIKDCSAKVWGSRNPLNVIKATFRMLQSGNAPLAMGNGMGGEGRTLDKGSGIRGKDSVERERGRKMLDLKAH